MKKTEKAQIRKKIEAAISATVKKLGIAKPSRKSNKLISKVSKALRRDLEATAKQAIKKPLKKRSAKVNTLQRAKSNPKK